MKLIDRIKWIKDHMKYPVLLVKGEELEEVEEALDKRTPKKPVACKYQEVEGYSYRCPNQCMKFHGYVCVSRFRNYCSNCGQAIDWSEVE